MIVRVTCAIALLTIFNSSRVSGAEIERHATADETVAIRSPGKSWKVTPKR
jgi:hypothetical protein